QRLQVLEIEQRQLFVVGDFEGDIEHAFLRLAQVHQARQKEWPQFGDGGADRMALLAEQVPEDDGIGLVILLVADLLVAPTYPWPALAPLGNGRKVTLNFGAEHRHALVRKALSEALQRHGLAGSGGAGDETVAVGEAEIDELRFDALADIDAVLRRCASIS